MISFQSVSLGFLQLGFHITAFLADLSEANGRPGNLIYAHSQWKYSPLTLVLGKRGGGYCSYSLGSLGGASCLACASVLSSVTVIVAKAFHPLFFLQAPNLLVHWGRLLVPGAVGHDYMANITGFETTTRDRECVSNRDYCCASPRLLYYLLCICWEHCSWLLIAFSIFLCLMMSFQAFLLSQTSWEQRNVCSVMLPFY